MLKLFHNLSLVTWLFLLAGTALAVQLPTPNVLEQQTGLHRETITVIEPHMSTPGKPVVISYEGLLTYWFGESWKAGDSEVVFFTSDGYRSVISSSKLKNFRAFLAFGRSDGSAFVLDNPDQNERNVPIGPYYLIWDNQGVTELLKQGVSGWPYQVTRIKLHSAASESQALLPPNPDSDVVQGHNHTREHCLTCHHIKGRGAQKYQEDLIKAACRWTDADLKTWIGEPARIRPGTAMPPLNNLLPADERRRIIEQIVLHLRSIKNSDSGLCAGDEKRH
jgi:cytochrome c2